MSCENNCSRFKLEMSQSVERFERIATAAQQQSEKNEREGRTEEADVQRAIAAVARRSASRARQGLASRFRERR